MKKKEFKFIRDLAHYLFEEDDLTPNEFEDKVDTLKGLSDNELYEYYNVEYIDNKYVFTLES